MVSCIPDIEAEDTSETMTLRVAGVTLKPLALTPGLIIQHGGSER